MLQESDHHPELNESTEVDIGQPYNISCGDKKHREVAGSNKRMQEKCVAHDETEIIIPDRDLFFDSG